MEELKLGESDIVTSRLTYGCMRVVGDGTAQDIKNGKEAILAAIDAGFTHFDHADIYGGGHSEELFGSIIKDNPSFRELVTITSKCGVRKKNQPYDGCPARYDLSKEHILSSVDGCLSRLNIDSLDLFLLHRPDYLFNPAEVAEAFDALLCAGKVRYFGVSNFSPSQVTLLDKFISVPLIVNQVEINIHNIEALSNGVLDQCVKMNMTPQAWCPLGGVVYPAWGNKFDVDTEKRIATELSQQAKKYGTEPWIVILAWLLLHPSNISPLIGSTNKSRIAQAVTALELEYTREDWYRLLEARNGHGVA